MYLYIHSLTHTHTIKSLNHFDFFLSTILTMGGPRANPFSLPARKLSSGQMVCSMAFLMLQHTFLMYPFQCFVIGEWFCSCCGLEFGENIPVCNQLRCLEISFRYVSNGTHNQLNLCNAILCMCCESCVVFGPCLYQHIMLTGIPPCVK
jgi:hypothetical protein